MTNILRCTINHVIFVRCNIGLGDELVSAPLKVLVIDENRARASIIEDGLTDAGYDDVTLIFDMKDLLHRIVEVDPDVIFIDLGNPNRDVVEQMFQVSRIVRRPVAMFVDQSDNSMIEEAIDAGVSAYVVDGLRKNRVRSVLHMAIKRFNAFSKLQTELESTKRELEDRKVIDRAKGILMEREGLTEQDAYATMRRAAMDRKMKIADIAKSLITAADLLGK